MCKALLTANHVDLLLIFQDVCTALVAANSMWIQFKKGHDKLYVCFMYMTFGLWHMQLIRHHAGCGIRGAVWKGYEEVYTFFDLWFLGVCPYL